MKITISERLFPTAIGISHLLLLGLCMYERMWEFVQVAEPVLLGDGVVILTSYTAQYVTVLLLLVGIITKRLMLTIPWILLCTVLFTFCTIFALFNISYNELGQNFINLIVVGAIWTGWYIIIRYNLEHNEYISNLPKYLRKYKNISGHLNR